MGKVGVNGMDILPLLLLWRIPRTLLIYSIVVMRSLPSKIMIPVVMKMIMFIGL